MTPKPKRIRDPKAIEQARKEYCQYCGLGGQVHVHHIKSRGAGGDDIPENLISLCPSCHDKAHRAKIKKEELRRINSEDNFLR